MLTKTPGSGPEGTKQRGIPRNQRLSHKIPYLIRVGGTYRRKPRFNDKIALLRGPLTTVARS